MGSALPQLHRYGIAAIVNTAALPLPGPPPPSPSPLGRGSWAPSWAPHLPVPRGTPRTVTLPSYTLRGLLRGAVFDRALRDLNGDSVSVRALHAVARPLKSAAVHRYCQHYSLLVRWRIVVGHDTRNGELSLISNLKFQIVPLIRRVSPPGGMSISAAVPRGMAGSRVRTVPIQYAPGATARGRWRAANSARLRSRHTPPLDTDSPLAHRIPSDMSCVAPTPF